MNMAFTCIQHCPLNHLIPPNPHHPTHLCPHHPTRLCPHYPTRLCLRHPTVHNKHPSHYKHEYNPPTFLERCSHVFRKDDPVLLLPPMMQHSHGHLDCHRR